MRIPKDLFQKILWWGLGRRPKKGVLQRGAGQSPAKLRPSVLVHADGAVDEELAVEAQAFKNVLPALVNEFIVLLKETSICGYIGLMDLTRGGDIIRSRTYEAFFPLIAVAIIYLVIVMLLTAFVNRLERRLRASER